MDWSDNIPASKDRPANRSGGFPSFLSMIGWAGIAFIVWFFWTLFSPPIMQQMFGPLIVVVVACFGSFIILGLIFRLIWRIISWPFRRG